MLYILYKFEQDRLMSIKERKVIVTNPPTIPTIPFLVFSFFIEIIPNMIDIIDNN